MANQSVLLHTNTETHERLTLKSQTVGLFSPSVPTDTDQSTRHLSLQFIGTSEKGSVGSTVAGWYTKSRRVSQNNVGAPFTGRLEHGQGQEVGRSTQFDALGFDILSK